MRRSRYVPLALVVGIAGLAACDSLSTADPVNDAEFEKVGAGGLLALCDVGSETTITGTAGVPGATLKGQGVTMVIPEGALSGTTEFRLFTPASPYAEVEIHANGQEHFQFLRPVVISISYDDCGTPGGALSAWHIDPDSRTLIEHMGGVNDVQNRRVTFSTMHLSGYAIAN